MYCPYCGKQVIDEAIYCPYCGSKIREEGDLGGETGYGDSAYTRSGYDDTGYSDPGYSDPGYSETGYSDSDYSDPSYGTSGYSTSGSTGTPQPKPEIGEMEKYILMAAGVIGFAVLLPLIFTIFSLIISRIYVSTYNYSLEMALMSVLSVSWRINRIVTWIVLLAGIATAGGCGYLLYQRQQSSSMMGQSVAQGSPMILVAIGTAAVTALSALASILYWPLLMKLILSLAALVAGADLFLNVYIEKNDLYGPFDLSDDLSILRDFFQKTEQVDPKQYRDQNIPHYEETPEHEAMDSYFDGSGLDLLVQSLISVLLVAVTCGIGMPWAIARLRRWSITHTVIEGKRQTFNGTGGQLFIKYLKWMLLSMITCGIYMFFAMVDYLKWEKNHTSYEGHSTPIGDGYAYSIFEGGTGEYIGNSIIAMLISMLTCGIGAPWGTTILQKWECKNTIIEGERYFYDGTGGGLFGVYIINALLTIITCGLYGPWAVCRINRFIVNHTHVDASYNQRSWHR